ARVARRQRMRRVTPRVCPDPAGARIARGRAGDVTARRCASSRSWSRRSAVTAGEVIRTAGEAIGALRGPADPVLRWAPPWGNLLPGRSSAVGPQAALTTLSQDDVANGRRP